MQTALLYFCLAGLAAALPVLLGIWLWRIDSHPVLEAVSRLRRLPVAARLVLVAFVAQLIVYGSTKTNGNGYVEGGVTNGNGYGEGGLTNGPSALPPPLMMLAGEMPTVFGFTSNQFAAGFVLSHVGFGDPRGFEMPVAATEARPMYRHRHQESQRLTASPMPEKALVLFPVAAFSARMCTSCRSRCRRNNRWRSIWERGSGWSSMFLPVWAGIWAIRRS